MAVVLGEPTSNDRTVRAASLLEHGFQHYSWKAVLNQTDIDNLPTDATAKPVSSVRDTVLSWDCGYRPKARTVSRNLTLKSRAARAKLKDKVRKAKARSTSASAANAANAAATKPQAASSVSN
jgi:D-alanyl-D-alanine carboxypeptidase